MHARCFQSKRYYTSAKPYEGLCFSTFHCSISARGRAPPRAVTLQYTELDTLPLHISVGDLAARGGSDKAETSDQSQRMTSHLSQSSSQPLIHPLPSPFSSLSLIISIVGTFCRPNNIYKIHSKASLQNCPFLKVASHFLNGKLLKKLI